MKSLREFINKEFRIPRKVIDYVYECEKNVQPIFDRYREIAEINQYRVIDSFKKNRIAPRHFSPSTGYGYNDEGREKLCSLFADVFGAQAAIVSPMFMSGTHAIKTALFGLLRPGDKLLSITGMPYDTLRATVSGGAGSLQFHGIGYQEIPLARDGSIDVRGALTRLREDDYIRFVFIQRSTGYDVRKAFNTEALKKAIQKIKEQFPDATVVVDNCYGEFVCTNEPTHVGADVIIGSLIKNPGGGLAPTGGYIAGRLELIEQIADFFTAPGVGAEIGSYAATYRPFFQGLFMAPHAVCQALQGAVLAAAVFEGLGYKTEPAADAARGDITQFIQFDDEKLMTAFVRGIQRASAVDGYVVPYAWDMPGYDDPVIMAAGTFVQGASLELTADGPMRKPYTAYLQGGLTYEHAKLGILFALDEMKFKTV